MMNDGWETVAIGFLLADEFPGEWGEEPKNGEANAFVLRSTNIDNNGRVDYKKAAKRKITGGSLATKKLVKGDILLEASGGGPNTPVGRVALFEQPDDETYICSNFFRTLRPTAKVSSRFLFWKLLWFYSQPQIWHFQQQTTGIINLKISEYLRAQIVLPSSKDEQSAIADILDTIDAAIQNAERVIAKQKAIRAGLLHDLLTYGLDANGEPCYERPLTTNLYGTVPAYWELQNLGNIAEIGSGVTLGRNLDGQVTVELPYLRVWNVQDGYVDLSDVKTVRVRPDEIARFRLQAGDVLMTEGGDFDKLGRGTVWRGEIEPCLHQNHIFRVRANQDYLLPDFLALVSGSPYGRRFFLLG